MIDIRKLKELVRLMVGNDLTELDLRDSEEQVTLRRHGVHQPPEVVVTPGARNVTAPAPSGAAATASSMKGCILAGERFQTVRSWPARCMARANAAPISPSPITVMSLMMRSPFPSVIPH